MDPDFKDSLNRWCSLPEVNPQNFPFNCERSGASNSKWPDLQLCRIIERFFADPAVAHSGVLVHDNSFDFTF
jgi:hypothetical protein